MVEILIVIGLIAIFSGLVIVNFRANEKERMVKAEALKLVDAIKRVQTMALTGARFGGSLPESYSFILNSCLSNCSFSLTANNDGSQTQMEQVSLANNLQVQVNGGSDTRIEIRFYGPRANPQVYLNGSASVMAPAEASLDLNYTGSSQTPRQVIINQLSGRIDLVNL